MRSIDTVVNRFLLIGFLAVTGVLIASCSLVARSQGNVTQIAYPHKGAPVTAAVDGEMIIITNNMPNSIYYVVFPTEILPVIEWAPCVTPERCPAEQRIDSGDEKHIALTTIVRDDTESLIIFWWHFLEKQPGTSIPPMELNEITVPVS